MWLVHILLLCLFCSVYGGKPGDFASGDWLAMTQALTRHGDRAAQSDPYITKDADNVFFRGPGELSTDGVAHVRSIGQAYRNVYAKNGWMDVRYNPKEIMINASFVDRVLMSAGAFTSGLFQDNTTVIPGAVYTKPYVEDQVLAVNFNCSKGWNDMIEMYNITDTTDMANQVLDAMRAKEWTCTDPPPIQSDTIIAEYANPKTRDELNKAQKACGMDPAPRFMYNYIERLGGSGTNSTDARVRLQRTIGLLANQTVDKFKAMEQCYQLQTDPNKVCDPYSGMSIFNFAHDVNLMAFMNVFSMQEGSRDFFQGITPAYASSLVMELWVRKNVFYVKMFVKNGADQDFKEFEYYKFFPTGNDFPRVGSYLTLAAIEKAKNFYIDTDEIVCN